MGASDGFSRPASALVLGLGLAALTSCGLFGPDTFTATGTVEFQQIEGGCWSIRTESERYTPLNLPEAFEEDGLRVRFEAERLEDRASICMVGPIIELHGIERR